LKADGSKVRRRGAEVPGARVSESLDEVKKVFATAAK
jgi:hypothetical protein